MKQFKEALKNFAGVFTSLPMGKKMAIGAVAVLMLGGILLTAFLSTGTEYTVLYSNLTGDDMLSVTQKLKEQNIEFKMERGGTVISVAHQDVYQLRMELAGEGLPSGGSVGFELFDKSTFGMTEFIQNLNYRRALQGELQRTISAMRSIKSSRVHIVIPKRNLFDDESSKSTASVVLKLNGSSSIRQSEIDSISHLVASSVEGLDANMITIVDTRGNLLSVPEDESETYRMSAKQMDYRHAYESNLEKKIRTMIERTVGLGKAVVRVSADINFRQVQKTEEIYDPASQVARSEQRNEEKSTGATMPTGIAGIQSNLPGVTKNDVTQSKPASSNKTTETINYEINKTIQTIIEPTSVLKKLSVAVLVDGKYKVEEDKDGKSTRVFSAISNQEKAMLEKLVKSTIGFDAARQDSVTIESMQFDISPTEAELDSVSTIGNRNMIIRMVQYAGVGIVGLMLFLFVLRPLMGSIQGSTAEVNELSAFPKTIKDMETELQNIATPDAEKKVDFKEKVSDLVAENPQQAASLVRAWLRART